MQGVASTPLVWSTTLGPAKHPQLRDVTALTHFGTLSWGLGELATVRGAAVLRRPAALLCVGLYVKPQPRPLSPSKPDLPALAWKAIKGLMWRAAGADAAISNPLSSPESMPRTNLCAAHARLEGNKVMKDSVHNFQAMPRDLCHAESSVPSNLLDFD